MPLSIVQWRAKIGVFNTRLNLKHLKDLNNAAVSAFREHVIFI